MHNTTARWGWLAKAFHWVMALMVAVMVPLGYVMAETYQFNVISTQMEAVHVVLSRLHQSIGLLVLILVFVRLGWRVRQPIPQPPPGLAAYHKILARLNHAFLYVLLMLLPLSGWAALSAFGEAPTYFLWMEGLPSIVPKVPLEDTFGYGFFARIHRFAIYTGAALLALHVSAALWHHFARKDTVLRRMWPLGQA
ncbi:MAG: cytochrome b [Rhodospirillaceae bacterium]|nr:cytochrome b [Rhodospirillaceae bacterium]